MSTREQTRQDLRDLARLAAAMPREHSTSGRAASDYASGFQGGSRITVPPTVATLPPPPPLRKPPRAFPVSGPPPPPVEWSLPAALGDALAAVKDGVGVRSGALLAAGLVVAMVGGLALGKSLSSHAGAGSRTAQQSLSSLAPESGAAAAPPVAGTAPQAANPLSMPPASASAAVAPPSPATSVLEVCAPVATFRAPRPNHHAPDSKAAPKPSTNSPIASSPPPAKAFAPRAHDSLDDLIRKAASN